MNITLRLQNGLEALAPSSSTLTLSASGRLHFLTWLKSSRLDFRPYFCT